MAQLGELIRSEQTAIVRAWADEVRAVVPGDRKLDQPALVNHMPDLLLDFADVIDHEEDAAFVRVANAHARDHAWERFEQRLSLADLVRELAVLRMCVVRQAHKTFPETSLHEHELLDRVVQRAIDACVECYDEGHAQLFEAHEQIAETAHIEQLDAFLAAVVGIFARYAPSADGACISLLEDGQLRCAGATGVGRDMHAELAGSIRRAFTNADAVSSKPRLIEDARWGAVYGAPLWDADEVVGVACIGHRGPGSITQRERWLFGALVRRATSVIVKHRLRAEAKLRGAQLGAVLEAIPSGIFVGDGERVTLTNAAGLEMLGLARGEHVEAKAPSLSARVDILDPATSQPLSPEAMPYQRALRGEHVVQEMLLVRHDTKEERVVRAHAAPVPDIGTGSSGAAVVLVDVTELHRAVKDLEHTAEFRERFIGVVGHDLRSPLNTIRMATSLALQSPELPASLAPLLERSLSSVDRMTKMIGDLLDFTRGRLGGGIPITPQPADLATIARRALDECEQTHPDQPFAFESRGDTRGEWDSDRVAQLLTNLLNNAVEHGVRDEPVRLTVDGEADAGDVTVTVHNAGPPIPKELLPHVFKPFRRARNARPSKGLGLGLFIACEVARAHRGDIRVSSDEGGTTFSVNLPRTCRPTEATHRAA